MNTKLSIKTIYSTDEEKDDLNLWKPKDPQFVDFFLDLEIYEQESGVSEFFQVRIVTPKALLLAHSSHNIIGFRSLIIIDKFDLKTLSQHLEAVVEKCNSEDIEKSLWKLQRYFIWDSEDLVVV